MLKNICFFHIRFLPTLLDMSVDGGWGHSDRCVSVVGGWSHSLAVTACGMAFGWGCGADGRIGVGCYSDQLRPSRIHLYNNMFDYRDNEHSGSNGEESEWRGSTVDPDEELAYSLKERECPVMFSEDPVRKVAAGYAHSAFLTSSGTLYTSGCGVSGQLARFENIKPDKDLVSKVDGYMTEALRGKGERNAQKLSEMIPAVVSLVPRPVQWPGISNETSVGGGRSDAEKEERGEKDEVAAGVIIVDVACGDHHTVAISASGELYTWGLDQAGQCSGSAGQNQGSRKSVEQLAPVRMEWIQQRYGNDAIVVKVVCGPSTTAAIIVE